MNYTPCQIRQVDFLLATTPCDRCGRDADRVDVARRTAIDIDLDQPVLLAVRVSVHYCLACRHYFRAQPPFLRRDAIYTQRVVRKAVEAVYTDGMAFRTVGQRLARDFWVQPSEAIIRRWCQSYHATITLDDAYQGWIVAEFSGILCVDELYQHDVALLLAVDPAAPEGDRVVGYQLVRDEIDAAVVQHFLARLAAAGIQPDEVITDGSALYPRVLGTVWPQAAHQLCLFHETRRLTAAAQEVIRQVRKALPPPPPPAKYGWGGPLRGQPPSDNPDDPTVQRWQARQTARHEGIAQVHALARQGLSQRAIARQVGLHRRTVRSWLQQVPPPAADDLQSVDPVATMTASAQRTTVPDASVPGGPHTPAPPPPPWTSWQEVRQVREALKEHRGLLLRRPDHLSEEQQAQVAALLASPVGPTLTVARDFLTDWYALWRDEEGQKRNVEEAQARYEAWRQDERSAAFPSLRRVLSQITPERFAHLSQFLRHPAWEATNNGAERAGRVFRHRQGPHFNLRSVASIDGALKVRLHHRKEGVSTGPPPPVALCSRGRRQQGPGMAA